MRIWNEIFYGIDLKNKNVRVFIERININNFMLSFTINLDFDDKMGDESRGTIDVSAKVSDNTTEIEKAIYLDLTDIIKNYFEQNSSKVIETDKKFTPLSKDDKISDIIKAISDLQKLLKRTRGS